MSLPKDAIVLKAYELLKTSIPMLNNLPRSAKFTLGERIQDHLADLLETYIKAYYLPAAEKRPLLNQANVTLEMLRYYFRLGYDLGHYNSLRYQEFVEKLQEIGKMTGGWLKSLP
jgi:23S rRNA-intervening sequence protein